MTDDIVLLSKSSTTRRKLHLPDPEDPADSICRFDGLYSKKPRAVVEDHYPMCHYCQVKAGDSR